ncbi:MAG: DNA-binding protein [Okeania sp. SIO3B5]|uniref:DNA-binding protein n=1 Tax=Okeania sp. SIO3B5 TaxID=2607811 RepID=UPI00140150C1|nr:DNA-binding protein [Okeania sp. SIO3B5]NEO51972.1 DNA-binding protein [Okeania sp. SIO3B5]
MQLQRQFSGQLITLDTQNSIGGGGEGRIYPVLQDPSLVAKIYHKPTDEDADKLTVMFSHPPDAPMAAGHSAIAWPVDLLHTPNSKQKIIGFLMPRVFEAEPIHIFYNPRNRREQKPHFNYRYLHCTARNLVTAVHALHKRDYAIGDINESNILVKNTSIVTLVDTDSFQVRDPYTKEVYRCPVGKLEFTPPELQGQSFREVDRLPEHDLFGVAVLIFQILMEGTHPFAGVYQGRGEPPSLEARIKAGHFPYGKKRVPYRPTPLAPDFKILHPSIQELFIDCFEKGHEHPKKRPDTKIWWQALREAEKNLMVCKKNHQHRYGNHLKSCPWCDRTKKLKGRDPFPSEEAVRNKKHLQPAQTKQQKLFSLGPQKTTTPKKLAPPKPIIINRKMGQYQPLLTPILTKTKPPSLPIIPLPGGGNGITGIAQDAMWGSLWGVLCAAAVAGIVLGIIKGSLAVFGGTIVGMLWGSFFALAWQYIIPVGMSGGSLGLTGAFWGGFIAVAISGSVYGIGNRMESFGQAVLFGGFLGTIWGVFWSAFKPPLTLPGPGRVWGRRGLFLGAIWGAFLGTVIGAILAGVFVFQESMNENSNTWQELVSIFLSSMIPAIGVGAICGIIGGAFLGPILGAPTLPLPKKLSGFRGAFLGGTWGCFLGVIIGVILGSILPQLWSIDLVRLMRIDQDFTVILSTIFGAGLGAIAGCFSGATWGGMGKW